MCLCVACTSACASSAHTTNSMRSVHSAAVLLYGLPHNVTCCCFLRLQLVLQCMRRMQVVLVQTHVRIHIYTLAHSTCRFCRASDVQCECSEHVNLWSLSRTTAPLPLCLCCAVAVLLRPIKLIVFEAQTRVKCMQSPVKCMRSYVCMYERTWSV